MPEWRNHTLRRAGRFFVRGDGRARISGIRTETRHRRRDAPSRSSCEPGGQEVPWQWQPVVEINRRARRSSALTGR